MSKALIFLAFCVSASAAWADNQTTVNAAQSQQSAAKSPSKAVKMTDAQLDKVTAGHTTIVFNPGNADVFIRHHSGLTCVNCQ